ncbi:MAG: hypothetical protein C0602_10950 [Denitrovibrio sp.]|nr:MAG: hypothetical protein C0602_10950 [Denitrovibrio sp.]
MKVSVVGGLSRMEKEYKNSFKDIGCKAKVFNTLNSSFEKSVKCSNCVVLLTTCSSHNMANKAKNICKKNDIPLIVVDKNSPQSVTGAIKNFFNCEDCAKAHECLVTRN